MKQPDFTKLFFDHFGGIPKKVQYEVRTGPYQIHDLIFLTSLIHDARFYPRDIKVRGSRMTIPIERDCWEIPLSDRHELHIAKSKLLFSSVADISWSMGNINEFKCDQELLIDFLYFNKDYRSHSKDRFTCYLSGHDWLLQFTLEKDDFKTKLQDQEVPYLYSDRHVLVSPG